MDNTDSIMGSILAYAFLGMIAFGFYAVVGSMECSAKTGGMTLPHRWGPISGCRVQDPRAGWVPLDNYRVL